MAYRFAQVRYNQDGSDMSNTIASDMVSGAVFENYQSIVQLGIQAPPGTKFYLGGNDNALIVGSSGVFQLNLKDKTTFTGIKFDKTSIDFVQENNSSYIIIDILYGGEG